MAESMVGLKRTHRCTEVTTAQIGQVVTVMGWVQKSRNKGGIIFVDLRDRSGILQIIFEEHDCGAEDFAKAEKLRSEFVVAVTGRVEARSGAVNTNLATGAIEIRANSMRILSESETPPFPIEENSKTKEELRLKYRFLDLRRPDLQRNLMTRSRVTTLTRSFLAEEGFLEIETPTLIKSTPEGARDYLVPSRVHPGSFYALPQSPQLFKQLLMCSGYDRYFQIARCYRDEDLRADRQPEFTQVDMELSFVDIDDVIDVNYVEKDEKCALNTYNLKTVTASFKTYDKNKLEVPFTMSLTFDDNNNCIVKQKEGADYVITGNGKFVKDGDKKSWGQEDRDAVYLDYTLTLGNSNTYAIKDTLVVLTRGVVAETFKPVAIP